MTQAAVIRDVPVLRLTPEEFAALPHGVPDDLDLGSRWLMLDWKGRLQVKEWRGYSHDGRLLNTYRPVIRVKAISRLVPRPGVVA